MYAELVERCAIARLASDFPPTGSFFPKTVRGRKYWYFQDGTAQGRRQRYVGPESPELLRQIAEHREAKDSYRQRRQMVTALQRAGLPSPDAMTGRVLEALAETGIFRLRAVVVGTVAYQAYSGLLGVRLADTNIRTSDLDLAQFRSISLAVEDKVDVPFEAALRSVDSRFRPIPAMSDGRHATRFVLGHDDYRVEILTPNRGPDDDRPVDLPALQAEGQPLRFLDFLIYQEIKAAVLWGPGILINVPSPERYALHKLLVSRRRIQSAESQTKARKDVRQAAELIRVLAQRRPYELHDAWAELQGRGPKWRRLAAEATSLLELDAHNALATIVGPLAARPAASAGPSAS
ncbi:MAG: nucleotidyltransferase family protein [Geminicoccaceae bacterium]